MDRLSDGCDEVPQVCRDGVGLFQRAAVPAVGYQFEPRARDEVGDALRLGRRNRGIVGTGHPSVGAVIRPISVSTACRLATPITALLMPARGERFNCRCHSPSTGLFVWSARNFGPNISGRTALRSGPRPVIR